MTMRVAIPAVLFACAVVLFPPAARPETAYPARPLRLLVGFTPGSTADIMARLAAARMAETLGQPVVVENRAGSGSQIAAQTAARLPADGYSLFLVTVANAINMTLLDNPGSDVAKDFAPIIALASIPSLVVVHPSLAVRSIPDLVAAAKNRPGQILFGSSGNGTAPHVSGELFNLVAGTQLVHVPYKGSPQAVADLLAGRVQVMFSPASTVLPYVKAGTLRALASTGAGRGSFPELPTVAESGFPGFESTIWSGLAAPAGTPPEIVRLLNREAARALADPALQSQFAANGMMAMGGSPGDFAALIAREVDKWRKVVHASGAGVD